MNPTRESNWHPYLHWEWPSSLSQFLHIFLSLFHTISNVISSMQPFLILPLTRNISYDPVLQWEANLTRLTRMSFQWGVISVTCWSSAISSSICSLYTVGLGRAVVSSWMTHVGAVPEDGLVFPLRCSDSIIFIWLRNHSLGSMVIIVSFVWLCFSGLSDKVWLAHSSVEDTSILESHLSFLSFPPLLHSLAHISFGVAREWLFNSINNKDNSFPCLWPG
jgi:hypothetical protein